MSLRFIQSLCRWQEGNVISRRLKYLANGRGYATRICWQTNHLPMAPAIPQQRFYIVDKTQLTNKDSPIDIGTLLERLDTQYKQFGNLNVNSYIQLLEQLESQQQSAALANKQLLTAEQANFLLGACGPLLPTQTASERLQLCERLWCYLKQQGQLQKQHIFIRLQVWQHNRAPLNDFRALLVELKQLEGTSSCNAELYAELLDTASSSGNMHQVTDVLSEMRAQELPLMERNFNALLLGHGRSGDLKGCQTALDSMKAAGVPLSAETQTALVLAYLENGEQAKASDLLLRFHRQFDANQVLRMLRTALFVDVEVPVIVQLVHELSADYTTGAEVPLAIRNLCIELMRNSKLSIAITIVNALPTPSFNENQNVDSYGVFLLQELFRTDVDVLKVLEVTQLLKESGKNCRALHLAIEMALRRRPAIAEKLLTELAKEEPLRPHYFWPMLLHNLRHRGEHAVLSTLQLMMQLGVACDAQTLREYVLPRLSITMENPQQAIKWLDGVGCKPSLTLMPVLAHLLQQQQLEQALDLMQLYPTKISVAELLTQLRNLSVQVRATKRYHLFAKLMEVLMQKSDTPHVDYVGQLLLNMVNTQERLRKDPLAVLRFCKELDKCDLKLSSAAFDGILAQLPTITGNASNEPLVKVLEHMRQRSLVLPNTSNGLEQVSVSTATNHNLSTVAGSTSSFIKHPRDMSLDELECHLIELQAKGMNTRGVLRRLLQLCVRDGRLERALEIKTQCDGLKVQISPGMLASIFDMYIKLKDLPNAELSLKSLQSTYPGFQIDEHKILDYAALLVHTDQLEAGKQLLQQRASSQKIHGGDYVLKNVWNFLTEVAHRAASQNPPLSKEQNWTRDEFTLLQQLGYCRSHNTILGPIVREYLLRNDISSAVAEFRRLAEQYKHTPLQFELLSLLVRLSNAFSPDAERFAISTEQAQQLLGEVSAIVTRVHGAINTNSALLLAFAESGTDNQLRRMLIDPEFRINQQLLIKNCEHLGQEGSVQTLLRLGRGARGFSRAIDEQQIYNMLLQNFVDTNNYAAALELFERLEMDDELKISQEFLRNVVKLLKLNNLEIPSSIALRAQVI